MPGKIIYAVKDDSVAVEENGMKCPDCEKEMETGFLTVPLAGNIHSMKWNRKPYHRILGGEVVYDPKRHGEHLNLTTGSVFEAHRCRMCNCILFYHSREDTGIGPPQAENSAAGSTR